MRPWSGERGGLQTSNSCCARWEGAQGLPGAVSESLQQESGVPGQMGPPDHSLTWPELSLNQVC